MSLEVLEAANAPRIAALWEESKKVLLDCVTPSGAIVAANSDREEYPPDAENYRFAWMRDTAFWLYAAHIVEIPGEAGIRTRYLEWLNNQAAEFADTGVSLKRYATNGALDWRYGRDYQPDQAGAMLWALTGTVDSPDELTYRTVRLLANGLATQWGGTHFLTPTQDLWENHSTSLKAGDVFTYSLAAAAHGLDSAIKYLQENTDESKAWKEARDSMHAVLRSDQAPGHYLRTILGATAIRDPDNSLDASLAGLIFPFSSSGDETLSKRAATARAIRRELCALPNGVERNKGDTYDGVVRPGGGEATAGRWPLLTFWDSIALNEIKEASEARILYHETVGALDKAYKDGKLPDNLIPEQLFPDSRLGVLPLGWSHSMFIIDTKMLKINIQDYEARPVEGSGAH